MGTKSLDECVIVTRCNLGNISSRFDELWETNFNLWVEFIKANKRLPKQFEDCNGINLYNWNIRNIVKYRTGNLDKEKLDKILSVVPNWCTFDTDFINECIYITYSTNPIVDCSLRMLLSKGIITFKEYIRYSENGLKTLQDILNKPSKVFNYSFDLEVRLARYYEPDLESGWCRLCAEVLDVSSMANAIMGKNSSLDVYKSFKDRYYELKNRYGAKEGEELNPKTKRGKLFITHKEEAIIFSKMGINCERISMRKLSMVSNVSYNAIQRKYTRGIKVLRNHVNYFTGKEDIDGVCI